MSVVIPRMFSEDQRGRRQHVVTRPEFELPLKWHMVSPGETVFSIAARYQCRPSQIVQMNHLPTRVLFPGTALRVPRDATVTDDTDAAVRPVPVGEGAVSRTRYFSTPSPALDGGRAVSPSPDPPARRPLYARADVKLVAENRGCVFGVLLLTPNRVRFEPHQSDPMVVDLGDEPFVASIPLRFIVSAMYYTEMAHIQQHLHADHETHRDLQGDNVGSAVPPESGSSGGAAAASLDGAADNSEDGAAGSSSTSSGRKRPCSSSFDSEGAAGAAFGPLGEAAAEAGPEPAGRPRSAPAAAGEPHGRDRPGSGDSGGGGSERGQPSARRAQSDPSSAAERRRAFARRVSRNSFSAPPPPPAEAGEDAPLSSVIPFVASSTESMDRSPRHSLDGRSDVSLQSSYAASLDVTGSASGPSIAAASSETGTSSSVSVVSGTTSPQPGATSSSGSYDTAPEAAAAEKQPDGRRTPPHSGGGGQRKRMRFKSEVSVEEKPSLFVNCDKLILGEQRPTGSHQPRLYLLLLLGKRTGEMVPTSEQVLYFGERTLPTYIVFAIPQDQCERLYEFLKECKPEICGPLDLEELEGRGYELIDPDAEHFEPEPSPEDAANRAQVAEPVPEQVPPTPDVPYLPELVGTSAILTDSIQTSLQRLLPARVEGHPWSLVFSSDQHGISLKTLYRKAFEFDCPMLLFIQDSNKNIFGALSSHPIRYGPHFYGTGESFLFTFHPEFRAFRWSGENQFFVKGSPESLEFGSGDGHAGLFLEESLSRGLTERCDTFHNEPLTSSKEFDIIIIELWALG